MTTIYTNTPLKEPSTYLDGTVYIGVATSDMQTVEAVSSIHRIYRRPGDGNPVFRIATKGAEAREWHIKQFLQSEHDFILFLDGDMLFPFDCLERLRSHGLPCVSGLYFRRTHQPMVIPIWFEDDPDFRWPMMPFRQTPQPGQMYRLGGTGFGIWLIHRSVFERLEPMLKGEAFVWQDDMDVWPYDLEAVMAGQEKLRILRGVKDQVGADLRLSFFIRAAGFTLWGDPNVSCGHYLNYPLDIGDWTGYDPEFLAAYARGTEHDLELIRKAHEDRKVKS
jgi:hypothetical protein